MSNEQELAEQLRLLRAATEQYGCLHDAQVYQLKRYPFVLTNVQNAEVHVDINNRKIVFIVETKGRCADAAKRYKYIDQCVKALLGDTWLVNIKTAKKTLYRGPRKKAYKPKVVTDGDSIN